MENNSLSGRVAVITGGTGGIGHAVAVAFAQRGCSLVVVDRTPERLAAVKESLSSGANRDAQKILALALDVTSEADMQEMARRALGELGRIDILVTCAGILRYPGSMPKPLVSLGEEEWDAVIDVNLKGVFLSNRAVLPAMIQQRAGTIINVSSTSGRQGKAHDSAYCASKFGVIGLSESLAEEVRPYGVKVQTVLPDAVDTPLWDQNGPIRPEHALPAERVGELIAFIASLPADTLLAAPVIAPFRSRKRVARGRDAGAATGIQSTESARGAS